MPHAEVETLQADGWQLVAKGRSGTRMERPKPHSKDLEDRVWALFYRMGFPLLSGDGGAVLASPVPGADALTNQLDCVALDAEVAIGVECKSSKEFGRRARLQEEIAKLAGLKSALSKAVAGMATEDKKRTSVMCMFLRNASLSDNDLARAQESNVVLFDDNDLDYYPPPEERPRSRYSMPSEAASALDTLLAAISRNGGRAILTFPEHNCSNGLSGAEVVQTAEKYFRVQRKVVENRFSTLGGTKKATTEGNGRSARQKANELILVLNPR